jgi:hypothetical protein
MSSYTHSFFSDICYILNLCFYAVFILPVFLKNITNLLRFTYIYTKSCLNTQHTYLDKYVTVYLFDTERVIVLYAPRTETPDTPPPHERVHLLVPILQDIVGLF